jgi:hypothetical protein
MLFVTSPLLEDASGHRGRILIIVIIIIVGVSALTPVIVAIITVVIVASQDVPTYAEVVASTQS